MTASLISPHAFDDCLVSLTTSQNISVTGSFNVSRMKGDAKIASVIGCAKREGKERGESEGGGISSSCIIPSALSLEPITID